MSQINSVTVLFVTLTTCQRSQNSLHGFVILEFTEGARRGGDARD